MEFSQKFNVHGFPTWILSVEGKYCLMLSSGKRAIFECYERESENFGGYMVLIGKCRSDEISFDAFPAFSVDDAIDIFLG